MLASSAIAMTQTAVTNVLTFSCIQPSPIHVGYRQTGAEARAPNTIAELAVAAFGIGDPGAVSLLAGAPSREAGRRAPQPRQVSGAERRAGELLSGVRPRGATVSRARNQTRFAAVVSPSPIASSAAPPIRSGRKRSSAAVSAVSTCLYISARSSARRR